MTADAPSVPDSRALADEAVALVREWLVRAAPDPGWPMPMQLVRYNDHAHLAGRELVAQVS